MIILEVKENVSYFCLSDRSDSGQGCISRLLTKKVFVFYRKRNRDKPD